MWKWPISASGKPTTTPDSDAPKTPGAPLSGNPQNVQAAGPMNEAPGKKAATPTKTGGPVAKSIQDWMREGEELYSTSMREYQDIESRLADLEHQLAAKQSEVNQIAQIIGKPLVEGNRRLTAQLVDDHGPHAVPNSPATIARALAGKQLNR